MKRSIYFIAAIGLLVSGCVKDKENQPETTPTGDGVEFYGGAGGGTETRTSLGNTDLDLIPVLWTGGDAMGIFAASAGTEANNARATLMEGAGQRNGKFTSMGIKMASTGNKFYMYYPYDKNALDSGDPVTDNPVKYKENSGNPYIIAALPANQTQNAPSNTSHFGNYGYSVAVSEPANKGQTVNFTMEHPLTYLEFAIYGSGDGLGTYSVDEITLTVPEANGNKPRLSGPFMANFNGLPRASQNAPLDIYVPWPDGSSPENFSNSLSLTISNPAVLRSSSDEAQRFVMAMLPADLTSREMKVVVKVSKGVSDGRTSRFYAATLEGSQFKSDNLYRFKVSLDAWERIYPLRAAIIWEEGNAITISDVELVTAASGNLDSKLANSFLIENSGSYSFPAKKADGTWVDGIEYNQYNYINFTVPAGKKGNALIGLYRWDPDDPSGTSNTILYSWHIWMTEKNEMTLNGVTMLDRNLGATSNYLGDGPSDQTALDAMGYYVQWGRKDIFARANTLEYNYTNQAQQNNTEEHSWTTGHTRKVTMNVGVFGQGIEWGLSRTKHNYETSYGIPTKMIDGVVINDIPDQTGRYLTEGHQNMPSHKSTGNSTWAAHANPCPKGYHVPTKAEFELIASSTTYANDAAHNNNVVGPATHYGTKYTDGTATTWFPRTGYRNNEFGNLNGVNGSTIYWTSESKYHSRGYGWYAYALNANGIFSEAHNGRISAGRAIRCVKDK